MVKRKHKHKHDEESSLHQHKQRRQKKKAKNLDVPNASQLSTQTDDGGVFVALIKLPPNIDFKDIDGQNIEFARPDKSGVLRNCQVGDGFFQNEVLYAYPGKEDVHVVERQVEYTPQIAEIPRTPERPPPLKTSATPVENLHMHMQQFGIETKAEKVKETPRKKRKKSLKKKKK